MASYLAAICVALSLGAAGCAADTAVGVSDPPAGAGDAGQTCTAASALVGQALAMRTDQMSAAQYEKGTSLATQLRALRASAEDDVLQERLDYMADAVTALAAAVQAGDKAAMLGAQQVLGGFGKACPISNSLLTQGTTDWAPDNAATVLQTGGTGPMGGEALVVTAQGSGVCGFHDSPRVVPSTLPGTYRLRLWVRSVSGHQKVTVTAAEMVGTTRVNLTSTTLNSSTHWQRVMLTVRPKAPKRSALTLDVATSSKNAGSCFLAAGISITWG
jgi:hypothetical protein